MKYISIVISVFLSSLLAACTPDDNRPDVSFYYWRTVFELSDAERQALRDNEVNKIYIRYFDVDVDRSGKTFPESPIRFVHKPENIQTIPVVYIKNKVMLQDSLSVDELAGHIISYIALINDSAGIKTFDEIQIDCDWTLKSRDKFMQFVDTLKRKSGKKLSATIRLHQVKHYTSTRIPDVDKGVLMYYNMGKIAADTLNSIYDRNVAKRYIESLKHYPLRLDIALPVYSWGVVIRDDKVFRLDGKINISDFQNDTNFTVSPRSKIIEVRNSNIKDGQYYLRNDKIKIEDISEQDLYQIVKDIKKQLPYSPNEIIFFDLNQTNIKRYEKEIFKKMAYRF